MTSIKASDYEIVFNEAGYTRLNSYLKDSNYSKYVVIVDTNTHESCLSGFLSLLETNKEIEIIEIPNGEENKTIDTCTQVWNAMAELGVDRRSLILNLGGGVVTDLGGFVASTFMRGLDFINIPTSLLAMVDASVGGKTGVDLGVLKNLVGVINNPKMVLIDVGFLATLPQVELRSGLAEIFKHGLIASQAYWNQLSDLENLHIEDLNRLIHESVHIKNTIVLKDPSEKSLRKTLNYGHTLGHAIESYHLGSEEKQTLLHGEAVAIGMILESYISSKISSLSQNALKEITRVINDMYPHINFNQVDIDHIINNLKFDKKNTNGQVNFVLLKAIGEATIDQQVAHKLIFEAFDYYKNL